MRPLGSRARTGHPRVARRAKATYEWHQHVRIATNGPLSREEILAIADGDHDPFDDREAALLAYCEAFVDGTVTDELHGRLADHYDTKTLLGITKIAQFYLGLAYTIDALGIETEAEFVGWELERLETH